MAQSTFTQFKMAASSYPPTTGLFLFGFILAFCSSLMLLISFCSPFWLESYPETYNNFVRLGLWEVCFDQFRFPKYQFDRRFHGCHHVYSEEYRVIQEWLLPGWYLFVQAMVAIAFLFSLLALCAASIALMRFFLRYEWHIIGSSFIMECIITGTLFLGVAVFGGKCWERDWLLYPNYNHLGWAYGLAVVSMFGHGLAAACFIIETFRARERKRKAHTLVFKMDSASSFRY